METTLLAEKLETTTETESDQKVSFINAFPSDTFLREFNFADWVIILHLFGKLLLRLIKKSVFSFQSAVYFAILKIRTHYSCTYKFPKVKTCKKINPHDRRS